MQQLQLDTPGALILPLCEWLLCNRYQTEQTESKMRDWTNRRHRLDRSAPYSPTTSRTVALVLVSSLISSFHNEVIDVKPQTALLSYVGQCDQLRGGYISTTAPFLYGFGSDRGAVLGEQAVKLSGPAKVADDGRTVQLWFFCLMLSVG
jgi:hypothetical protein